MNLFTGECVSCIKNIYNIKLEFAKLISVELGD